jgi:hypothetical protein
VRRRVAQFAGFARAALQHASASVWDRAAQGAFAEAGLWRAEWIGVCDAAVVAAFAGDAARAAAAASAAAAAAT